MKVLLSWLREYLDLPETPQEIAIIMTRAGIEVDRIEELSCPATGIIAVRILETSPHPHDPKLSLATISDGAKKQQIVCGAANCRKGILSAFAPVNAQICKEGALVTIAPAEIKKIESLGCLCSEAELGLTSYSEGICVLPETIKEGTLLDTLFSDTAFEVSLTPNLGHCMSIMGIARELSAFLKRKLKKKPWQEVEALSSVVKDPSLLSVTIEDSTLCSRYSALLISGVKVQPSSFNMRLRLERSGIRSINNVVDSTNYVSLDLGQPLHAFDADKISDGQLIVRAARAGETLHFLDGETRPLPEGSCIIADREKPLAAAGIMGGSESAVSDSTTRIIFESANFQPSAIRKAKRKLQLQTDSAKRFERGCDSQITLKALEQAVVHLEQIIRRESVADLSFEKTPEKVICRTSRTSRLLGYEVSANEMESAFSSLYLPSSSDGQDTYTITVPSFRHDIHEEVDLIEEVGRLVGLQEGKEVAAPKFSISSLTHSPLYLFEKEVRTRLLADGLQEFITCDLISPTLANIVVDHPICQENLVNVLNPLSLEQSILRPSLLPGLLQAVARNISQRVLDVAAFEVSHVHLKKEQKYQEPLVAGIILTGKHSPLHFSDVAKAFDFFDLKGILETLFSSLEINDFSLKKSELSIFHPGQQAKIYLGNVHVGMMGQLHPAVLRAVDIDQPVFFAECDLQEVWQLLPKEHRKMRPLALYPASERDWTVTISKALTFDKIMEKIQAASPSILESTQLVSIYENEKLGKEKHNLTFRFVYRDREKTISQEEVEKAHAQLISQVSQHIQ